ncbi:centrosome-associated protein 350 isoform X1 [Morone saxatilis]|uniref:centrosome-associated protein 350 isoform X1 n=1 Tax=Morone saxatilis TaxID=34816 RepID=UPI0015E1D899|nr:centrosome-associated protein 350 isoform X1 [Morone saxatilis]XP_035510052.1 centrosome-associated protein 350 isoform X1 [Morone saxatilis]XP_035510054.1 centrosome-associated protein 350 isoform X1 [Morone saxatilis]XP_035510055.1 centrosome-associated protein 350 isoform X1 [Morone saxatilis]
MRSSRRTEVSLKSSAQQLTDPNIGTELTTAWKSLAQSKAALRHIENRLEAAPGTGVLLESVMDPPKKKSSRAVRRRDGRQADDNGGSSKHRGRSQQSPEKSSSRSPLRNTTQDSNVRRNNSVEFREPLASYREATPPPHPSSQLEAYSLQSVPGSACPSTTPPSDPLLSQLVYQRDTRDKQTDRDLDSTHSSALESTEVRYLNDQPALVTLRTTGNQSHLTGGRVQAREGAKEESTPKAQFGMDSQESSPCLAPAPGSIRRGESTPSTSPGSASQRLENLRRHQPDDKLEKLKERIRRQRQHLEEAAEREKLLGYLEQPIMEAVGSNNAGTSNMPTAKIRKVAAAPPAPIYKGFNSAETKIQTPDGKVWKEDEFHNLSREIYRDLSRQFAESTRSRHQQQREQRPDRSKERRPTKPVRKVHRAAPSSDLNAKPVISPASWREGQKLVKMVLGPVPKLPREDRPQTADGLSRTASHRRSSSDPRSESKPRSQPNGTERPHSGFRGHSKSLSTNTSTPSPADRERAPVGISADLLSADIQGILDDLQLECKAAEKEERARQRSRGGRSGRRGRGGSGSQTRTPVSAWGTTVATGSSSRGCRSASPSTRRPETANIADTGHKKRHYDADSVRQYISKQQEERKRRQAEEKRALREEAERRNQRLQELYRKQKEVAKTVALPSEAPVAPVQKRLQETYNKLLLEEAQLGDEATQMQPAAPSSQMRPMYQPSGESDKENKRLEAPQSPSSSDRSLNDQPPPPLSRNDLDVGVASLLQPDRLSPAVRPMTGPSSSALAPFGDHLLSRLLRLETAVAASDVQHTQRPVTVPTNRSKMSRIEALKATAASLSNRIESEARKLAGEGINYGTATSMDVDTILAPRPSQANPDDGRWAETAATENNDMPFQRIHRILTSTGHSSYNGTSLPGAGNLHALRGQKETKGTHTTLTNPQTPPADLTGTILNSYTHERRKLVNGLEKVERIDKMAQRRGFGLTEDKNQTDLHDSSASSISEGPLLSEGSFSEDEASPPHPSSNRVTRAADCLEAVDYCAGQRRDYHRLSEFQREAVRCSALSSPFAQHDGSKAAWEELNRGSPLSVINIFTKNLHGHVRVSERNSPPAHSLHSESGPVDAAVYEDDFVSSHSSGASGQLKRASNSRSVNNHFEELMRRSPYEKSIGGVNSHQSSFHSSIHSPHLSSGSPSGSSPKHSARKRGTASDQSDATLVEEQRSSCSPPSVALSSESRKRGSDKSSAHSQATSVHSNDTSGETCHQSLGIDSKKSSAVRTKRASPSGSLDPGSPPGADSPSEPLRSGSLAAINPSTGTTARNGRADTKTTGELQYSPAVLQQRMAAELQYLESIEESVRQLGDVERLMGVSMAQQESASLAQMLKVKQQRHERDLYELKIKAEREALEAQLQMEENRQRVARAHIELQESLAGTQKETLEGLQEATTKMMSQQAEAARYTADTARHIKEMTELARSQIAGALVVPPVATNSSMLDKREEQEQQEKIDSDSFQSELSSRRIRIEEPLSSLNSLSHSDSLSFRRPNLSGVDSNSHHSPSHVSSDLRERTKKEAVEGKWRKGGQRTEKEAVSSSIEDEVLTAANGSLCSDSFPSVVDEKGDSTSVATEYSLKFDESMTEDEIEERSFRSLLPSEAHRRGTKEKKSRHHEESEDDGSNYNTTLVSGAHNILKSQDANMAFSGGQDSFSQFTMDMVRQYMKDEEVRLQHQSSLLRLRQKALKEKTRTELAWLEHQKKRLRDKGEDDKMPPIRKKQRGLLLKLQQEQAEIKRLQEANKAARKERQLLLKQQEEIERMRNSTLRLKERLKSAGGEAPPETPVSETPVSEAASSNMRHEDIRSPSPSLSISGSETSSIMQKLKKMRSHMDEKHCSPVHYFFSVFTAHHWASLSVCLPNLHPKFQLFIYNQLVRFLTKREQQLMQRRYHAEELLQWKQRLDQEEAEVRRMEKEALAVWDRQTPQDKDVAESQKKEISDISPSPSHHLSSEPRTDSEKEYVSEGDSATPESSIHTEGLGSQQPGSPSSVQPASIPETPLTSVQSSPANYTQDFSSASQSPSHQSPFKGSHSPAASPSDGSSKTKMQLRSSSWTANLAHAQPTDSPMAMQTEPISDQSDIESRIKALKEELRKRKFMAYQLKKEQKKRHKERLKAQEASLLKQLESYDNFIEKTKAELNKGPDSTPDTKSPIKDSTSVAEQSSIKLPTHRSETSKISDSERMRTDASLDHNALPQPDHSRSTSVPEELSDEDPPTVTPTPVYGSPECQTSGPRSHLSTEGLIRPSSKEDQAQIIESGDENIESYQRSYVQEELEVEVSSKSEDQHSQYLLKLEEEDRLDSQEKLPTSKHVSSSMSEEHRYSPSVSLEQDKQIKTRETSEAEQAVKSNASNGLLPVAVDLKPSPHPSYISSFSDHSYSPDSVAFSSKKEAPIKDVEVSSPIVEGYNDDFESSVYSSPREEHHSFKPASQISVSPTDIKASRKDSSPPLYDSQDEEVEEEIAEELSHHSGISGASHQSGRLLDLHNQTEDSKHDSKDIISSHSPPISPMQTPLSPVIDEMSTFNIGDRVLVGGVQPGTLRFKGPTSFANGFWAGVELDKSEGSNNGTYDGVVYFNCDESHGIFAPPDKITHLPDKFEIYTDTTEDEDSFFDDLSDKGGDKRKTDEDKSQKEGNLKSENEQTTHKVYGSGDKKVTDESVHKAESNLNSHNYNESKHPISNGNSRDIILDFEDAPTTLLISDIDKICLGKQSQKEITTIEEREDVDSQHQFTPADLTDIGDDKGQQKDKDILDTFADKLLNNFMKDTVKQFSEIKKAKEQKIEAANQMNGDLFGENEEWFSSVDQKDGLPFFLPAEKEELSSPELCNRPESPVLGASGQEELAKRLAELELSRELLDELGDDEDWFDEDFGLSSRREQQRLKQKEREEEEEARLGRSGSSAGAALGGLVSPTGGEQQVKTPPRPELPLPLPPKLPEQPAMVVPHSAIEVEKMVHAATQEIWESCGLGKEGALTLAQLPNPKPSQEYLGKEASSQDQEALSICSYRKAVYDLTWEMLQEIYAEDPNTNQPQWVKPRRVKSSFFHRVKTPGDITKIQEYITGEVLKLYGLTKDQSQKTDWQKMLKFGRKKRDRVDHILVQELHEEEAQWVNYDEDELFVKMQLADSIFDALLKDTANVLTLIYDKRAKRDTLS